MASAYPSAVVCGSQTPPPSRDFLQRIQSNVKDPKLKELAKAVDDLPRFWSHLVEVKPVLSQVDDEPLKKLKDWATADECLLEIPEGLPNILMAPLTVIIHLVQYLRFVLSLDADDSQEDRHQRILHSICKGGFQGLCTGFLSAAALACSGSERDIWCNATVALRLATCVGAYVDLDRLMHGSTGSYTCVIIHWEDSSGKDRVTDVLKQHPGVYTSVELDDRSITVTARLSEVSSLRADLEAQNAKVTKIPVNGRYHSKTHAGILQDLLELCETEGSLRFPIIDTPLVPLRNNTTGGLITSAEKLHELALKCVLTEPADWLSTMTETVSSFISQSEKAERPLILELGLVSCLPRSLTASASLQVFSPPLTSTVSPKEEKSSMTEEGHYHYPEHSIAVIGAACKFAGAEAMHQFWDLIQSGGTKIGDLPEGRIAISNSWRKVPQERPLRGNFLSNADHFDHGLFGVSPREATYMDPQQRIALHVAYQAVESSEYFGNSARDKNIGCYVGVGGSDYDHNVGSHAPTAFSFTGTARAFVSGRISHYFGWTGPSMTIDTACSSSAVAIHQACKDIRMGECSMALAGGVNIISCPNMQQNLAAARFLSPTGPCRPFDASADGYCRGEGCGFVMLKKLSCAVADNDDILGVIVGSAVNHCDGNEAITVPTSHSQVNLYRKALSLAAMQPKDITYVEAHGTGTPRGDPVECRSIRQVFGGSTLHFGSVKANIGHAEAASGIAGLLKVLLMIRNQRIPPQANFTTLNASIPPLESDNMSIPTNDLEWKATFRVACINNYGAAGNNAAVIVCQPPTKRPRPESSAGNNDRPQLSRYPFLISGQSERSLKMYCTALSRWLENTHAPLSHIAFNVARRQNRTLRHRIIFDASSRSDLNSILGEKSRPHEQLSSPSPKPKPVVLVFAGQTGNIVYLHKAAYEGSSLLRSHIDQCDGILRKLGYSGLIPFLFGQQPIEDVVLLHCLFFSLQYACAAAWIDAGLPVKRVIGHSIGQFTAMCISGVTTLTDTLKLVAGRARLIQQKWGKQRGCMLAVEVGRQGALELVRSVQDHRIEIACFNGARNHVLVGTEGAIQTIEAKTSLKTRKLKTTHGFHSELVDSLLDDYMVLARSITYATPNIPVETCSMGASWKEFTPEMVVRHSREAVYFFDAISRVDEELGPCTWVEGGAGSRGIALVKCALGTKSSSGHSFHRLQLDSREPLASLAETTLQMWNEGLDVQFWLYHTIEKTTFDSYDVPGYQFEETAYWLSCSDQARQSDSEREKIISDQEKPLVSLLRYEDSRREQREWHFEINHSHPDFSRYLNGREVLGEALCPVSVFVELATQAVAICGGHECSMASTRVQVLDLEIHNPLGRAPGVRVGLRLKHVGSCKRGFSIISEKDAQSICHATGTISLQQERHGKSKMGSQWSAIQRVIGYSHIQNILNDPSAISMKGSLIYKILEKVAEYEPCYRGIKAMTIKDTAAVAQLEMPVIDRNNSEIAVCNLMDQFALIAEVQALCRDDCKRDDVFICSGVSELATFKCLQSETGPWTVYTRQTRRGSRELVCDTFVFDSTNKTLIAAILGARFIRITISSLQGIVKRAGLNSPTSEPSVKKAEELYQPAIESCRPSHDSDVSNTLPILSRLLHEITGIPPSEVSASTLLVEAGVDSLAATELENRVQEVFNLHRPVSLYERQFDVGTLCREIQTQRDDRLARASRTTTATRNTSSSLGRRTSSTESLSDDAEARPFRESDAVLAQLSRMLSQSFNITESILPETELRSLGLDSLVAVELESDLEEAFGLKVDLMRLSPELTMGELARLILASKPQTSRHMAPSIVDSGQMTEPESQTYFG
ncbi:non-reducing polyketide synthase spyA [Aspergillus thermomutatus]|uniref:Carrier domain-containing protein n=1 Tax=Aspergillus thermomutatus TaxID=41047 RepID=A0A397GZG2_ASPTH|nr:uncharacterized protein CDV56_105860 [Aspergillus thermomutatus]RHZ54854.1 hypothetical protein CDV56_105860 [Aspergillus thermomutatus]